MKKTGLVIILITSLFLFTENLKAQTITSRDAVIAKNDSVVSISCPSGYYLSGIKVNDSLATGTDTLFFKVKTESTDSLGILIYDNSVYSVSFTGLFPGISFKNEAIKNYMIFNLVFNKKQTKTIHIKLIYTLRAP